MRTTTFFVFLAAILIVTTVGYRPPDRDSTLTADEQLAASENLGDIQAALARGALPNGSPDLPFPPLCLLAVQQSPDAIQLLVSRGANPDGTSFTHPLIIATACNQLNAVRTLLRLGANPNITSSHHLSALHLLASNSDSNLELVRVLLEAGADPTLPDADGRTPLDIARENNSPELVQLLLTHQPQDNHPLHAQSANVR